MRLVFLSVCNADFCSGTGSQLSTGNSCVSVIWSVVVVIWSVVVVIWSVVVVMKMIVAQLAELHQTKQKRISTKTITQSKLTGFVNTNGRPKKCVCFLKKKKEKKKEKKKKKKKKREKKRRKTSRQLFEPRAQSMSVKLAPRQSEMGLHHSAAFREHRTRPASIVWVQVYRAAERIELFRWYRSKHSWHRQNSNIRFRKTDDTVHAALKNIYLNI